MASNASSSSSSNYPPEAARPQAGPLPRKRGEIGFRESRDMEAGEGTAGAGENANNILPERHPADTQVPPSPAQSVNAPEATSSTSQNEPTTPSQSSDTSSTHKAPKSKFLTFFGIHSKVPKIVIGGISILSYLRLFVQLLFLGGTLAGWIIITKRLLRAPAVIPSDSDNSDNSSASLGGSASIFAHVTFAIAVLGQLLFLERCIYHMRAQRYAYKHPGATLPTHGSSSGANMGMGFAPWSRPPLPTYAATLAQSGYGTGDVEDNIIAIPPPPAYGNTRGSRLLLAGFVRNSLRGVVAAQRDSGDQSQHRMSTLSTRSRPMSYRSQDEGDLERGDAERAIRLSETLQQLEEGARDPEAQPQSTVRTESQSPSADSQAADSTSLRQ